MIDFIILVLTAILGCYLWLKHRHSYWKNCEIPYLTPDSLIFGNSYNMMRGKSSFAESIREQYNDLAPHKFGGVFRLYKPVLIVRDLELIKHVLIKDFHHFRDRDSDKTSKEDALSQNLFDVAGDNWNILRHKLTPTFTSGKMKYLFDLMKNCAVELEKIIDQYALDQETVDVKDLLSRYSIDVISSCAFGLEANSLQNPDSEFRMKAIEVLSFDRRQNFREVLFTISPALVRFLRFPIFPKKHTDFFVKLVGDTIDYRKKHGVVRRDLLNLLMDLQSEEYEKENFDFNLGLLTAQCFVFFLAGFETTSTLLSFILYELAEHPDEQKKLQEEVDHVLQKHEGQISYDTIKDMHYMDQVLNETSRLYPAIPFIPRMCTETYRIPDSKYVMKKGDLLAIPVFGIHRDPQYYPNPDVFNPENFSHKAKMSRPANTFLSFGDGPRNCIGMRFGILQVKLALALIMKGYTVTVSPEMERPPGFKFLSFLTIPKNKILLSFKRRDK